MEYNYSLIGGNSRPSDTIFQEISQIFALRLETGCCLSKVVTLTYLAPLLVGLRAQNNHAEPSSLSSGNGKNSKKRNPVNTNTFKLVKKAYFKLFRTLDQLVQRNCSLKLTKIARPCSCLHFQFIIFEKGLD